MTTTPPRTSETFTPILRTEADLRAIYRAPNRHILAKDLGRIDAHFRRFIERSPFACLGTVGPDGLGDVTPRGGAPGFIHVLEERLLGLPDRPGNNRLDTLTNLVRCPGVGLLFFIPGFEDTLRVNGTASVSTDEMLMRRFTEGDKPPRSVVLIDVKEIYLHCTKAIRRADLWNPANFADRSSFPTTGEIYRDQLALEYESAAIDAAFEKDAREHLY
jgi:PPOX class probable FMN-dependent enzyme